MAYRRPPTPYQRKRRPAPFIISPRKKPPKNYVWAYVLGFFVFVALIITGIIVASPVAVGYGAYIYYSQGLPSVENLDQKLAQFETTRIYDRNGTLLYEYSDPTYGSRTYVSLSKMPKRLIQATLATEDPTFYQNSGVDFYGILRAIYINFSGKGSSGASTITQQLVRELLLTDEKYDITADRKIRELILATRVADAYPGQVGKDRILEMYLNQIYYGNLSYGVEAAAQSYFSKPAADLSLAESALLAGLPQAPSYYDPTQNASEAKARQKIVLGLMVKAGYISEEEEAAAAAAPLEYKNGRRKVVDTKAPHFVNYILQVMQAKEGAEMMRRGGFNVYTSLDLPMNEKAQEIAKRRIDDLRKQNANNAALVAVKADTGEVLAMIGSADYGNDLINGQYNVALAERQPGSSFKPITYAAAMEKGWTASTIIEDLTTQFTNGDGQAPYVPHDYDFRTRGPVPLRNSLAMSLNIPAVKALQFAGVQQVVDLSHAMGISGLKKSLNTYGLALTLGGGEVRLVDLTQAYTTFPNLGQSQDLHPILKIERHGKIIEQFDPNKREDRKQVMSPQVAYIISNILSDDEARAPIFGRGSALTLPDRPVAAKSGTTDDFRDSWTMGYTQDIVTGVWVGNTDNTPMAAVPGAIGAGFVWHDFMAWVYSDARAQKVLQGDGAPLQKDFQRPPDIAEVSVCTPTGLLPTDLCPVNQIRKELFPKDRAPTKPSALFQKVRIHKTLNCIAGNDYPDYYVESKVVEVWPTKELQQWAKNAGHPVAPANFCPPYVPNQDGPPPDAADYGGKPVAATTDFPNLLESISSPAAGAAVRGTVTIIGTVSADHFRSYRLEYASPGGAWVLIGEQSQAASNTTLGYWNTDSIPEGRYNLRLVMTNESGQIAPVFVQAVYIERSAPSVSITAPAQGTTVTGQYVRLAATAQGISPIDRLEYLVDGVSVGTRSGAGAASLDWPATPGEHILTVTAITRGGQRGSSPPVTFRVSAKAIDTQATIQIVSPSDGAAVYVNSLKIDVVVGEPTGNQIALSVDGAQVQTKAVLGVGVPISFAWLTQPGKHIISATVFDSGGKALGTASISVTVQKS